MELQKKVCLVAGASGTIGAAVARRFLRDGADLALTYRSTQPTPLRCETLGEPRRIECYRLDVTDWRMTEKAIQQILQDFGAIDALVNCTGVLGPIGPLEELDGGEWIRTIETNLIGSFHLVRAVIPIMKQQGHGKIVLFSGGGAAYGRPFFTPYSSSKAAVVRLAESLAEELAMANIQVNAIAPGPVNSQMWKEMRAAGISGGSPLLQELKLMDETGGASPDRAAGLAAFLASDRSSRLSGRLLSAIWDDWEHLEDYMEKVISSEAWTLRRVPLN